MGDRANIYLVVPAKGGGTGGIYLYTHWSGCAWPERLREALEFGRDLWSDDQYLARIITSRVFSDCVDSKTGAGLSLVMGDNEHPIIICDLINHQVSFADEGEEANPDLRYGHLSFSDYVKQNKSNYP